MPGHPPHRLPAGSPWPRAVKAARPYNGSIGGRCVAEAPASIIVKSLPLHMTRYRLAKPDKMRDTVRPGVAYTLVRLEEYEKLTRCGVCNTSNKTRKRVLLRETDTRREFFSGLDCLEIQFGISEADLDATVRPLRRLATYWLYYVSKTPGLAKLRNLDDVETILGLMATFFVKSSSFRCPAVAAAELHIRAIVENLAGATRGTFDDILGPLLLLVGLQHDYAVAPALFEDRLKAWNLHPRLTTAQRGAVRVVHEHLEEMTWERLIALEASLREAQNTTPIRLHHRGMPAYAFPEQGAYERALREAMEVDAEAVSPRASHVQLGQATIFLEQELGNQRSDLRKNWRLVFSVAGKSATEIERFSFPSAVRSQVLRRGFQLHITASSRPYSRSAIKMETGSVRQMQRRSQLADTGRTAPREESGFYRGVAVWRPDKYEPVFEVWNAYGGVPDGPRVLLDVLSGFRTQPEQG